MKQVVRLTEGDLVRIVKRVINESQGICVNPERSSENIGQYSSAKLVVDINNIRPVQLQNKIKNAHHKTGVISTNFGKTMYANSYWDWNDIMGSVSSAFGEKLGEIKLGPKALSLYDNLQSAYVEWEYKNNQVIFYFFEIYGC